MASKHPPLMFLESADLRRNRRDDLHAGQSSDGVVVAEAFDVEVDEEEAKIGGEGEVNSVIRGAETKEATLVLGGAWEEGEEVVEVGSRGGQGVVERREGRESDMM